MSFFALRRSAGAPAIKQRFASALHPSPRNQQLAELRQAIQLQVPTPKCSTGFKCLEVVSFLFLALPFLITDNWFENIIISEAMKLSEGGSHVSRRPVVTVFIT